MHNANDIAVSQTPGDAGRPARVLYVHVLSASSCLGGAREEDVFQQTTFSGMSGSD